MKYGLLAMLFLANNEIVSLLALCIMSVLFMADIVKERMAER